MKRLLILFLLLGFAALVIWGVNTAAAGTHLLLQDAGYQPFFDFQELF